MNKSYVTIISDQKGGFSFHTSWKSACVTYGWEITPRVPSSKDEYSVRKAPFDVTIKCLELVEFLNRKDVSQGHRTEEDGLVFEVSGYDTEYHITCDYEMRHEEAEYHHGDRGREEMSSAYDYACLTNVLKLEIITEDGGIEIPVDEWTEGQIIDKLDTNEIEN